MLLALFLSIYRNLAMTIRLIVMSFLLQLSTSMMVFLYLVISNQSNKITSIPYISISSAARKLISIITCSSLLPGIPLVTLNVQPLNLEQSQLHIWLLYHRKGQSTLPQRFSRYFKMATQFDIFHLLCYQN